MSLIDSTNDIKLSPLLSYSLFKIQRKNKESIFYSYNETKYGFLTFDIFSTVQIFKNDILIKEMEYDEKKKAGYSSYFCKFEKNQNYTIYFYNSRNLLKNLITLQLFNESNFFKHDFKTEPMLFYKNIDYCYEIDISNYKINDIILFQLHIEYCNYAFNYQYKSKFNGKNFIDKRVYEKRNFISIKKTIEESSLFIYVPFYAF